MQLQSDTNRHTFCCWWQIHLLNDLYIHTQAFIASTHICLNYLIPQYKNYSTVSQRVKIFRFNKNFCTYTHTLVCAFPQTFLCESDLVTAAVTVMTDTLFFTCGTVRTVRVLFLLWIGSAVWQPQTQNSNASCSCKVWLQCSKATVVTTACNLQTMSLTQI